jgi:hypothetical protein
MAKKKVVLSLPGIPAQLDSATKKLRAIRRKVSVADRRKIDLEIKKIAECKKSLNVFCKGRMTHTFAPLK